MKIALSGLFLLEHLRPEALPRAIVSPHHHRGISANTPQPRYSRV